MNSVHNYYTATDAFSVEQGDQTTPSSYTIDHLHFAHDVSLYSSSGIPTCPTPSYPIVQHNFLLVVGTM